MVRSQAHSLSRALLLVRAGLRTAGLGRVGLVGLRGRQRRVVLAGRLGVAAGLAGRRLARVVVAVDGVGRRGVAALDRQLHAHLGGDAAAVGLRRERLGVVEAG